jgi:DNA-binding NtrC family response regulator
MAEDFLVILIVEDDPLIQILVEEQLTDGGFELAIATSGEEAPFAWALRSPPDSGMWIVRGDMRPHFAGISQRAQAETAVCVAPEQAFSLVRH